MDTHVTWLFCSLRLYHLPSDYAASTLPLSTTVGGELAPLLLGLGQPLAAHLGFHFPQFVVATLEIALNIKCGALLKYYIANHEMLHKLSSIQSVYKH